MNTRLVAAALATAFLIAPAAAPAANPELKIPDFSALSGKARESVDLTVDGFLLKIAKHFAASAKNDPDTGEQDKAALELLAGVKSIRVRNFEFDADDAYSSADIDAVRKQLSGPGWSALVQAHRRRENENVDVYVCLDGQKVLGLAVIASEPREFTIVNIVGSIDVDKLAQLDGELGIPKGTMKD